jgi:hypothetical protein
MEKAGWVESVAAADAGNTRKRSYRVLLAGEVELQRWAREPSAPLDLRDEVTVRLRADAALGPLGLEDELRRRIALHEEKLQSYRDIEARDFPEGKTLGRDGRIRHMILKKGILFEQGSIAWTQDMLDVLESS